MGCFRYVYCDSFLKILLYFHLVFYYHPLEACCLLMRDRKGADPDREGRWGGTGKNRGRQNNNQDILCEKKYLFSMKGKKEGASVRYFHMHM